MVVVVAAALASGGWWFHGSRASRSSGVEYVTGQVSRGTIRTTIQTSGPLRALITVQVGSQLSGQIIELRADYNTEVEAGQVLAVIDPKTFEVRVAQAKADLASAEATVVNQQAALGRAEAGLKLAEQNLSRREQLASRGVASRTSLDTASRDMAVAQADLAVGRAQISVAEAQVAQRKAALRQAEIDLERTMIRSPIDGTVISRTVDQGQTVAASLQAPELFRIAQDLSRISIEAQVNEADIGNIKAGNPATFTVDAYPERKFEGRVSQVRLAATEVQNVVTYTVIIEARNDDRRLYPGMTANVEIETERRDGVLRLPAEALRFRPDRPAGGGLRDRSAAMARRLERLKSTLSLDDKQVAAISDGLKRISSGPGDALADNSGGDPESRRNAFAAQFAQLVKSVLTEQQQPAFERWQRARAERKTVTVWQLAPDGTLDPKRVRIGVADDAHVEVLGRSLGEGDSVIIRRQRRL